MHRHAWKHLQAASQHLYDLLDGGDDLQPVFAFTAALLPKARLYQQQSAENQREIGALIEALEQLKSQQHKVDFKPPKALRNAFADTAGRTVGEFPMLPLPDS